MYPVLFSWGHIHLYSYGLLVALGVLTAVVFLRSNAERAFVTPDTVVDLAMTAVLSGFTGARIFYVIQYWNYFSRSPVEIFKIWQGGIVLYGGLIGGLLGFWLFIRLKRLSFFALLDLFVPALALAQGFGRIGCFLNGCCYGIETNVPWAVSFPFLNHPVHPTQLYEAVFCFALVFFLMFLLRRKLPVGTVSFAYFTGYPIGRFVLEFLRGDNAKVFLNLTSNQWIGIALAAISLILFSLRHSGYGAGKTHHRST